MKAPVRHNEIRPQAGQPMNSTKYHHTGFSLFACHHACVNSLRRSRVMFGLGSPGRPRRILSFVDAIASCNIAVRTGSYDSIATRWSLS